MAGALGVGSTTLTGFKIRTGNTLDGSGGGASDIFTNSTIQSTVTSVYYGHRSFPATQATAFTLGNLYHFVAEPVSLGAGSAVTTQIGYYATGTGATNNYGLVSGLAAGANNWNLYASGTANNYMAGNLGIGSTALTGFRVRLAGASGDTGSGTASAVYVNPTFDSTVTNFGYVFRSSPNTTAAAYTLSALYHFLTDATTIGAGSTLSNNYMFYGSNTSATGSNNYSFYSNVAPSAANNWNLYFTANTPSYMTGALGIGTTTLTGYNLHIARQLTGATTSYTVGVTSQTQSDVTTASNSFISAPSTQATAFTLPAHYHYVANDISIGAGSAVTNQRGFTTFTHNNATNNFGFYGGVNTGAGSNWNFYASGTAPNYMVGALGIGTTTLTGYNLNVTRQLTGATTAASVRTVFTSASDVTVAAYAFQSQITTAATAYTLTSAFNYVAEGLNIGAGSTVTNQYGFTVSSGFTAATNNYAFRSDIASGANRWNFYASGTANNAYAGNSRFGGVTAPVAVVDVTGNVAATTSILSTGATSGVGYATGAGGAVTQLTSRTTGVTLNNVSGAITLVSAAGSASYQTFTVTNSAVAATDVVIVNQKSGTDKYITMVTTVAAGSFQITFATTGGTTTEQPVFNFAVIKAVAA